MKRLALWKEVSLYIVLPILAALAYGYAVNTLADAAVDREFEQGYTEEDRAALDKLVATSLLFDDYLTRPKEAP